MHKQIILICGLVFLCTNVLADVASIYQIEMVIFENNDPKRFDSEQWPSYVGKLNTTDAIQLSSKPKNIPDSIDVMQTLDALDALNYEPLDEVISESVTVVDKNRRLLNREVSVIKSSDSQRFIQYLAWSQPVTWNVKSTPVYIEAGDKMQEITGVVSLKPVRGFYQMYIDLIYKVSDAESDNKTDVEEFRLTRVLKLKKKEMYYLDHPVFGAIIMVSPVIDDY